MSNENLLKPGTRAPKSGQYEIVGPRGGKTEYGEITSTRNHPLPPTPKAGLNYILIDQTKPGKK